MTKRLTWAVVGSRSLEHRELTILEWLDRLKPDAIISGGARGPDEIVVRWAQERDVPYVVIRPNWTRYGLAAGPKRNQTIVNSADIVLAFYDGKSKGTADTIRRAQKRGLPTLILDVGAP